MGVLKKKEEKTFCLFQGQKKGACSCRGMNHLQANISRCWMTTGTARLLEFTGPILTFVSSPAKNQWVLLYILKEKHARDNPARGYNWKVLHSYCHFDLTFFDFMSCPFCLSSPLHSVKQHFSHRQNNMIGQEKHEEHNITTCIFLRINSQTVNNLFLSSK